MSYPALSAQDSFSACRFARQIQSEHERDVVRFRYPDFAILANIKRMTRLRKQDAEQRQASGLSRDYSEALARGLQVIVAFSTTRGPMSLTDISRAVDLPKATVRRALITLEHLGYLDSDGRLFRLTPQILDLAHAYLTSNMVSTVLQPACERLMTETGHLCAAAVLDKAEIVMIARAVPAQAIHVSAGIGFRLPASNSALGRVLLSALPDDMLEEHLAAGAVAGTAATATDTSSLRRIVRKVRASGYAYVDGEVESGFRSVAVPVRKFDGSVVAAIHLGSRSDRVSRESLIEHDLPLLRDQAEALARQLM